MPTKRKPPADTAEVESPDTALDLGSVSDLANAVRDLAAVIREEQQASRESLDRLENTVSRFCVVAERMLASGESAKERAKRGPLDDPRVTGEMRDKIRAVLQSQGPKQQRSQGGSRGR